MQEFVGTRQERSGAQGRIENDAVNLFEVSAEADAWTGLAKDDRSRRFRYSA